jgi:hypothetical protein
MKMRLKVTGSTNPHMTHLTLTYLGSTDSMSTSNHLLGDWKWQSSGGIDLNGLPKIAVPNINCTTIGLPTVLRDLPKLRPRKWTRGAPDIIQGGFTKPMKATQEHGVVRPNIIDHINLN